MLGKESVLANVESLEDIWIGVENLFREQNSDKRRQPFERTSGNKSNLSAFSINSEKCHLCWHTYLHYPTLLHLRLLK